MSSASLRDLCMNLRKEMGYHMGFLPVVILTAMPEGSYLTNIKMLRMTNWC